MIGHAGHDIVYRSTREPGWEKAIADADLVAVAGGDGTVGKALTALGDIEPPLIAVLPLGSANNIARALGIDNQSPEELTPAGQPPSDAASGLATSMRQERANVSSRPSAEDFSRTRSKRRRVSSAPVGTRSSSDYVSSYASSRNCRPKPGA